MTTPLDEYHNRGSGSETPFPHLSYNPSVSFKLSQRAALTACKKTFTPARCSTGMSRRAKHPLDECLAIDTNFVGVDDVVQLNCMNTIIEEILATRTVVTPGGEKIPLHSSIDREEGNLLLNLFQQDTSIQKTLEVGCAYGLSSLFIAEGLRNRPNRHHTIVDPFQNTHWKGVGIGNLKKAGFEDFELIEEKSEFALPAILKNNEGQFDLIFIDGFHTFDHTLVDCFYASRLLRVGGYLVVDDVGLPAVRRVMDYFTQYPCYTVVSATTVKKQTAAWRTLAHASLSLIQAVVRRRIFNRSLLNNLKKESQSMVALKKSAQDDRQWDWYSGDF